LLLEISVFYADPFLSHTVPGHIPKLHSAQYSILGMDLSEKSWIYLLALQLLFSDGVPSVVSALSGLLAGYLYQSDTYGFQGFRLPGVIEVRISPTYIPRADQILILCYFPCMNSIPRRM